MNDKIIDVIWIADIVYNYCSSLSSAGHFHNFFQMVYVVEGEGDIYIDERKYHMEPECVYIIPPSVKHCFNIQSKMTTIEVKFYINDNDFKERITSCSSNIKIKDDSFVLLLQNALKEYTSKKIYKDQMLSGIIHLALIEIIRKDIAVEIAVSSSEKDKRIQKIEQYINKHLFENITLCNLSKEVYMNPDSFLDFYKKYFGITPIKHINKMRISCAKDFLMHSELSVTQIAERCGYSSVHHFSKRFKNETKISPDQFRKKYGSFKDEE